MMFNTMEYLHHFTLDCFAVWYVHAGLSFSVLKDPGGLTDYIDAEYIPDFLGGPYEVRI